MLFFQYFFISIVLQLLFSELLTINGFQPNIMLLFVVLSQMPESNTSKAVLVGFGIGLFCDLVLFTGSYIGCLLYTSPSPRDGLLSRMPSSA